MITINEAEALYFDGRNVDAVYLGDWKVWPEVVMPGTLYPGKIVHAHRGKAAVGDRGDIELGDRESA